MNQEQNIAGYVIGLAMRQQRCHYQQQGSSAEIARDRLLWCQHHDPVTRPSQKRQMAEFKSCGYAAAYVKWPGRAFRMLPVMRRGKPVLTTFRAALLYARYS